VVWVEIVAPRRKRRPYRNPLRKLRKQLRGLRRERRRLLKKRYSRLSPSKGKPSVEPRLDSIAEAGQDAQEIPVRNNRLGRPATIKTNHVFCPNENCRGFQVMGPDLNHWIVGHGTYTTQGGEKRQMFLCKLCDTPFSETRGTVSTVLRWLRRAGQHSAQVSAYLMRNFQVEHAQLDELWTFVLKKEKTLSAWEKLHTEYGDNWIWTAIDPVHKLVLAFVLGDHEEHQAVGLLKKLKAVLAKDCMPLFTSDQSPHYISAILKVFGRLAYPKRKGACGRFPNPRFEPSADLQYATVHPSTKNARVDGLSR
jgi:hypothetical protein